MQLITVLIIAISLAIDCFAISITSGAIIKKIKIYSVLKIASFFGFFQGLMTIIGWYTGSFFKEFISNMDHWVAFIILTAIGLKMIFGTIYEKKDAKTFNPLNWVTLIGLAIATSIDALAVGITLPFMQVNFIQSIIIISSVSFIISIIGIYLGKIAGTIFHNKAEIIGGMVLILIGLKILIEHLIK